MSGQDDIDALFDSPAAGTSGMSASGARGDTGAILDTTVELRVVLGTSTMQVSQLLKLGRGAVVELNKRVNQASDVFVGKILIGRGEVVVVEDKLGISLTEVVKSAG